MYQRENFSVGTLKYISVLDNIGCVSVIQIEQALLYYSRLYLYLNNIGFGSVGCGRTAKGASDGKLITTHKTFVFICLCTHLSLYL